MLIKFFSIFSLLISMTSFSNENNVLENDDLYTLISSYLNPREIFNLGEVSSSSQTNLISSKEAIRKVSTYSFEFINANGETVHRFIHEILNEDLKIKNNEDSPKIFDGIASLLDRILLSKETTIENKIKLFDRLMSNLKRNGSRSFDLDDIYKRYSHIILFSYLINEIEKKTKKDILKTLIDQEESIYDRLIDFISHHRNLFTESAVDDFVPRIYIPANNFVNTDESHRIWYAYLDQIEGFTTNSSANANAINDINGLKFTCFSLSALSISFDQSSLFNNIDHKLKNNVYNKLQIEKIKKILSNPERRNNGQEVNLSIRYLLTSYELGFIINIINTPEYDEFINQLSTYIKNSTTNDSENSILSSLNERFQFQGNSYSIINEVFSNI